MNCASAPAGEPKMNTEVKDLRGQRFNRLVVQKFEGITPSGHSRWLCLCDCGKTKVAQSTHLKRGHTKSCGCLLKECHAARKGPKGGQKHIPLFSIWKAMIRRTTDPKADNYFNYGGRGISVCKEWRESFDQFVADIGPRPTPTHTLDRKEVNGNYEPGNVRWATPKEQGRNKRSNRSIEFRGQIKTISEWSEIIGITIRAMDCRLRKWGVEMALTIPAQRKGPVPQRDRPEMTSYAVY